MGYGATESVAMAVGSRVEKTRPASTLMDAHERMGKLGSILNSAHERLAVIEAKLTQGIGGVEPVPTSGLKAAREDQPGLPGLIARAEQHAADFEAIVGRLEQLV